MLSLTVRVLGLEVLHLHISTDPDLADADGAELAGGTTVSTPVGFTPSAPDQRWIEAPTPTLE